MLKILIVSYMNTDAPSGVRVYYQRLAEQLQKKGHEVRIVTEGMAPRFWHHMAGLIRRLFALGGGLDRRLLAVEWRTFLRTYFACRHACFHPDIIHAQDPGSAVAAGMAFRWRVPVVVTCHFNDHPVVEIANVYAASPVSLPKLTKWFHYLFTHLTNYICVSHYAKGKIHIFIPKSSRVAVIHNGIDYSSLANISPATDLLKRFSGKKIVLNVGHLEKRKNQSLLLNVAADTSDPSIIFCLAGDGEDRKALESSISSRCLQERVFLIGQRNDIPAVMHAAHLYTHTALNENCPLAIIEAMACGLPVLALATGGTPELFPGTEKQALFDACVSAKEISHRIVHFLGCPKAVQDLVKRQSEAMLNEFNIINITSKTVHFYETCLPVKEQKT